MKRAGNGRDLTPREVFHLPARSWASCANNFLAQVSQTMSVIKGGGLRQPGVAEHLQASRLSSAPSSSYQDN